MLAKRIIPCLDVKDGRVVKGVNFEQLRDAGDPVECAELYNAQGADEIVFLDITASHEGRATILDIVERTAESLTIPLTVGGGIREVDDIKKLLDVGADKVSMNSSAVAHPSLISSAALAFGSQAIVVAVDAKRNHKGAWNVVVQGGRKDTGMDVLGWVQQVNELGAGEILLTSMDRDGTRSGFDVELTAKVADAVSIPVIASGGVGKLEHFAEGLIEGRAQAVLAASVFHDRQLSVAQVKQFLIERGVCIRPVTL